MSTAEDWNEETYVLSEDEDGASPKKRFFKPQHRISPIKSFLHHKKLAALTVVLVAVAAEPVLYYRAVRPIYRAESVLAVAPIMLKNVIEDREYQLPRYDEVVNEQISILQREEVTLAALEQLKNDSSLWVRPGEGRREAALRLSASLQARRIPDSTYISVGLESGSPAGLSQVVNAVVAAYLAQIRGRGIYGQEVKEETLQERRQELREAVRKRVEQLAQWSKELGVANFEKAPEPPAAENKVVFDARARLMEAVAKHEALKVRHEAQLQSDLTAEARELLPTDPEVLSMKAVFLPKRNELRSKAMGLTPEHEGRKEIERLVKEINDDLERGEKAALARIRLSLVKKRELQLQNEYQMSLSEIEQAKQFQKSLDEEQRAQAERLARQNALYYTAMNVRQDVERLNRQLAALEDRIDALHLESQRPGFVTLVSPARTPEKPISRPIGPLIGGFALLALFLAFLVPTAVDAADQRIRSPIDVESVIEGRPLGWVLDRTPRTQNFAADQIRRIALSLERHRRIHQRGQIAFMSLRPGGGTTELVLSLAHELRGIGARVIVVEANAVHPDGRYQAPKGHPGLVGTLAGQARVEEAVLPPRGLLTYRIPIGNTQGTQLLPYSRNLRAVLDRLAGQYDIVLIDAPPLMVSSDAELISTCAHGVVLVVEAGKVVTGELKRAMGVVTEIGPVMVNVVVNRVRDYQGHGYYTRLVEQYESAGRPRTG